MCMSSHGEMRLWAERSLLVSYEELPGVLRGFKLLDEIHRADENDAFCMVMQRGVSEEK